MTLKIAIVGCGKIADGHAEEIAKLPPGCAALVACCDREILLAEQLAARYGIPRHYDGYEEMLARETPDVVHVTTPPASHVPLARQAIDAGAHVYVEKPFALSAAEARELLAHADEGGRRVTVGWSSFFDPPALDMRARIARGAVGDPVHVESAYGYDLRGPFGRALLSDGAHWVHALPGKLLHNVIDHPLSKIAEFLTDDEPEVCARAFSLRPERFGDARDALHDELRVLIRGARVSAYCTFSSHIHPSLQFLRVYGTRGSLDVDFNARLVTRETAVELPSAIGRVLPAFVQARAFLAQGAQNVWRFARADFQFFAGLQTQLRRFYDACEGRGDVPIPYRDIVRVCWLMDEIWRQVGPSAPAGRP
jgi:predicted dehydrogenase